jgi:hypothetical protein
MIDLPKPDNRYKPGKIVKDKKGMYRGHSQTVELKRMTVPSEAPAHVQLNPPLVATKELAEHLSKSSRED